MPINFPNTPTPNQQYTYSGKTWLWNGTYWDFLVASPGVSSITAGSGLSADTSIGAVTIITTGTTGGSTFTGGTVSGATNFTNGLSANTFSATTYLNLPSSSFTGGTVTGATNFTGSVTASTFSATTVLADNILKTVYRLPSSVALPVSTTTTAATINIPRSSVFVGQTIKVEGIFVGQQPTAANKTITNFWNNGANGQSANVATTSNSSSFGFIARVTSGGVIFPRQSIYTASNNASNSYSDVGSNITIRLEINPSTSAATLEHLVVTVY